jgi:amidase
MNGFAQLSATKLVEAINDKRISSVELLELFIERYERLNHRINAIVATDLENARKRAYEADEALSKGKNWGPLHGLPMTIKDCIEVAGMHCTWGSPIFKDYISTKNADVVQSLVDAGAIVFGKTNLPLWAMDSQSFNEVYGQTNNPWDVTRTPGGSSGGAAAALAAGLTGLEIGTDIGGSIRSPAHFCGVYGHKPSYDIVPMHGQAPPLDMFKIDYSVTIDIAVTGPLARSAEDLELVMDLVIRPSRPQRKAINIKLPAPRKKNLKEYRVGLWIDDPLYPPDTEVGDCLQNMADNLSKAGAKLEVEKPDIDFRRCHQVWSELVNLATVFTIPQEIFDHLLQDSKKLDKNDQSNEAWIAQVVTRLHREWQLLNGERSMMRQKWADFFCEYDVLLCPAVRIAAFHHDHTEVMKRVTRFNNQEITHGDVVLPWAALTCVSYLPATVAPVGFSSNGLPIGVQIVGPYLEDHTPIHFAKLLEELTGGFISPPGFE